MTDQEKFINCEDCRSTTPCNKCDLKHYTIDFRNRKTTTEFSEKGTKEEVKCLLLAYLDSLPEDTKISIRLTTEQWVRYAKELCFMDGDEFIRKEYLPL